MTNISISDLNVENSESTFVSLKQAEIELVKVSVSRALDVRGGFMIVDSVPIGTDGYKSPDMIFTPSL